MKRFAAAFLICFALLLALNAVSMLPFTSSDGQQTYVRAGFPLEFLRGKPGDSNFRPFSLCADVAFALYVSFLIGRWWKQRGTPDYLTGEKT